MTASSGLHRTEGLAVLGQGHCPPIDSGYPGVWWCKRQCLLSLGREDEARRGAEEALKLDPGHCRARQLLESL